MVKSPGIPRRRSRRMSIGVTEACIEKIPITINSCCCHSLLVDVGGSTSRRGMARCLDQPLDSPAALGVYLQYLLHSVYFWLWTI